MNNIAFKVSVSCMTYNQSKYIEDAMNGFCMQKTDFPFVCTIVDDASTDGEQKIITTYLENHFATTDTDVSYKKETKFAYITFAQHKDNKNCYFVVLLLKENLYQKGQKQKKVQYINEWRKNAPYTALCEGDDYWTNPLKLQMQVDFLENNPNYTMCFHNAIEHWEDSHMNDHIFSNVENRDYTGPEIYRKWTIPTASVMLRSYIFFTPYYLDLANNKSFCFGDILLFISCAHFGKLRGFEDCMSVYRRHSGGVTNHMTDSIVNRHDIEIYRIVGGDYREIARHIVFHRTKSMLSRRHFSVIVVKHLIVCLFMNPLKFFKFFMCKHRIKNDC